MHGATVRIEYSLFKPVNCSTCFGWYFTHHQQLITLCLQYLASMRPVQLTVVNVAGREVPSSSTGLTSARCCRYSVMSSWWWVKYRPKLVEQLTHLNKLHSVTSCLDNYCHGKNNWAKVASCWSFSCKCCVHLSMFLVTLPRYFPIFHNVQLLWSVIK